MRDRLLSSQHNTMLMLDSFPLPIMESGDHPYAAKAIRAMELCIEKDTSWKDLVDNRDFRAMVSFDPPDRHADESPF